jgi:Uma2 family endonuclease
MQNVLSPPAAETIIADRLYTAEELMQLSKRNEHRYELNRGVLKTTPLAGIEHGIHASRLGALLQIFVEEHDLGVVVAAETGFYLERNPDTVRAPDAAFIRKDRLPEDNLPRGYFLGAPDLAAEVVSPGDTADEVNDKVQTWLHFGAQRVWVLSSRTMSVTVYRPDGSAQVLTGDDLLDGEDVLPGFQVQVSRLFR